MLKRYPRLSFRGILLALLGLGVFLYLLLFYSSLHRIPDFGFTLNVERRVIFIEPKGVADHMGLQVGDQITRIGSDSIESYFGLLKTLKKARFIEEEITLEAIRDGSFFTWEVPLPPQRLPKYSGIGLVEGFLTLFLGVIVLLKRPRNRGVTLFYLMTLSSAITIVGAVGGIHFLDNLLLSRIWALAGTLTFPFILHFVLTFPKEIEFVAKRRYLYPFIYLLSIIQAPTYLYLYQKFLNAAAMGGNDLFYAQKIVAFSLWILIPWTLYWIFCSLTLWIRYLRTASFLERKQLQWMLAGGILAMWFPFVAWIHIKNYGLTSYFYFGLPPSMIAEYLMISLAIVPAVFKYRLMDVDFLISRGIIYLIVSTIALLLYLTLVAFLSHGLGEIMENPSPWTYIGATLAIAIVVSPIEKGIRQLIDRKFYRDQHRYRQAIQEFGEKILTFHTYDPLFEAIAETLKKALPISQVAIYVHPLEETLPVAFQRVYPHPLPANTLVSDLLIPSLLVEGKRPLIRYQIENDPRSPQEWKETILDRMQKLEAEVILPLLYNKELLGWIALGEKSFNDLYSSKEMEALTTLANEAAIALQNASAYEALQKSHQTIENLNQNLREKVGKIESQQQQILILQEKLLKENIYLKQELHEQFNFEEIVGSSSVMRGVLKKVEKVAATSSVVLIRGENGTGKELIARAIHFNSPRKDKPFIRVNCAALPHGTLESELFGHERGAFTGAFMRKEGRFELADGGTLFLDEIGDIPLDTQVRLLRVLQEKEFERVGGTKTLRVDVRMIAATHQSLERLIQEGRFREDLFYRLNVISIDIPPLRERREDLYPLVLHFMKKYNRETGKNACRIEDTALDYLRGYRWPGNVRELENLIERAIVLGEGEILKEEDFIRYLSQGTGRKKTDLPTHAQNSELSLEDQMRNVEKGLVEEAWQRSGGNKTKAAELLGLNRTTFLYKLKTLGIEELAQTAAPRTPYSPTKTPSA
ncbi:MAG: sigma 54-interacting transcriptional regulator [Deltaproteobacteria bacterium]|nr:sigma 54-interacting transcriptional regulator [Deltaproteobacteria bacterium]